MNSPTVQHIHVFQLIPSLISIQFNIAFTNTSQVCYLMWYFLQSVQRPDVVKCINGR